MAGLNVSGDLGQNGRYIVLPAASKYIDLLYTSTTHWIQSKESNQQLGGGAGL